MVEGDNSSELGQRGRKNFERNPLDTLQNDLGTKALKTLEENLCVQAGSEVQNGWEVEFRILFFVRACENTQLAQEIWWKNQKSMVNLFLEVGHPFGNQP